MSEPRCISRRGRAVLAAALTLLVATPAAAAAPSATSTPVATTGAPASVASHSQTVTVQTTTAPSQTATATETATQTETETQTVTQTATASTTTHARPAHTTHTTHATHKTHKPAAPAVSGWLLSAVKSPRRAMLVQVAGQSPKTAGVTISENGQPVAGTTVRSLSDPAAGDLAITFLVDQNTSMKGEGIASAMGAVRAFAGARSSATKLGLMTFAEQTSVALTPTAGTEAISQGLQADPLTSSGADLSAADDALISQSGGADALVRVAVVISDGVGITPTSSAQRAAASRAHLQIITVGLQDAASTPASLAALRSQAPGLYVQTTPTEVAAKVESVLSSLLDDSAIAGWTSHLTGTSVAVRASVTGATGAVQADYQAPPAPAPSSTGSGHAQGSAPSAAAGQTHHAHPGVSALAGASALSPSPGFTTTSSVRASSPAPVAAGFWHSGASKLVTALLVALLVGAIVMLLLRPSARDGVRERVGSYIPQNEETEGFESAAETSRRGLLANGRFWPPFVEAVEISRNPKSAGFLMRRAMLISLPAGVVFAVLTRVPFLFIAPILAAPFVERWWVFRAATKQRTAFRDTLPSYMQDMASAIRVGRSFVGALAIVADSAEEPTRSEFERAVTDESLGRPLDESLSAVGYRMQSMEMDQIALIAELNRRSGSNVAEALDRVAEGARDRADLMREMKALTAQAKMSSSVLTGMPVVLLLALSVIAPSYSHPLFHSTMGLVALIAAMIFVVTGWKVMKKISDVGM